ncbi:uncharacterized protein EAE98_003849 [Botrytis deweyae]|uniref:Uncharacterized protein n=1 Tax=Botrytis deweyae TaxID=2478750 RepID=A0ABQ7IRX6_9HELO|nr:uncharacterized protein EAE98_003849 [Botrytis deweyae]KAF7932550.1 hypothetical protein EAE98_003849 [Botrytis deweyae]
MSGRASSLPSVAGNKPALLTVSGSPPSGHHANIDERAEAEPTSQGQAPTPAPAPVPTKQKRK